IVWKRSVAMLGGLFANPRVPPAAEPAGGKKGETGSEATVWRMVRSGSASRCLKDTASAALKPERCGGARFQALAPIGRMRLRVTTAPSRGRFWPVFLTLTCGFAMALLAFHLVRSLERDKIATEFDKLARDRASSLQETMRD